MQPKWIKTYQTQIDKINHIFGKWNMSFTGKLIQSSEWMKISSRHRHEHSIFSLVSWLLSFYVILFVGYFGFYFFRVRKYRDYSCICKIWFGSSKLYWNRLILNFFLCNLNPVSSDSIHFIWIKLSDN